MTDSARFGGTKFSHEELEEKYNELNTILQNLSKQNSGRNDEEKYIYF